MGEAHYDAGLERRIEAMRALLTLMHPGTHAEALGILRRAFPDAPLVERIAALSASRSETSPQS